MVSGSRRRASMRTPSPVRESWLPACSCGSSSSRRSAARRADGYAAAWDGHAGGPRGLAQESCSSSSNRPASSCGMWLQSLITTPRAPDGAARSAGVARAGRKAAAADHERSHADAGERVLMIDWWSWRNPPVNGWRAYVPVLACTRRRRPGVTRRHSWKTYERAADDEPLAGGEPGDEGAGTAPIAAHHRRPLRRGRAGGVDEDEACRRGRCAPAAMAQTAARLFPTSAASIGRAHRRGRGRRGEALDGQVGGWSERPKPGRSSATTSWSAGEAWIQCATCRR